MSYYDFFDNLFFHRGRYRFFFLQDLSSEKVPQKKLTKGEKEEREGWTKTLVKLREHYGDDDESKDPPAVKTTEDVMAIRLPPPRLAYKDGVTARTEMTESRILMYPDPEQVLYWDDFIDEVPGYLPKEMKLPPRNQLRYYFLEALVESEKDSCGSERSEERYLLEFLKRTLVRSGILSAISYENEARGVHGKADFTVFVNGKLAVVGESKSTHNLLLPSSIDILTSKYQAAYKEVVVDKKERTIEWSHIARPIAQLLCYMVDNKRRYGALTCATRTYFLFLEGNGAGMKVKVSDPYFLGEETYLRAWSYIASLGAAQKGKFVAPSTWFRYASEGGRSRTKPEAKTKGKKRGGGGQSRRTPSKKPKTKTASSVLKRVPFQDLQLGEVIGFGRNGSVFEVQWMNRTVALKQYDLEKGGYQAYQNELTAYARLQDDWGRLCPEPLFVSESLSGGILYLGLEAGRDPSGSDYASDEWSAVLHQLENIYGIRHRDAFHSNGLIVTRDGRDRMVAIDFEDWSLADSRV